MLKVHQKHNRVKKSENIRILKKTNKNHKNNTKTIVVRQSCSNMTMATKKKILFIYLYIHIYFIK